MPGGHGGKLEAVGARALSAKDADPLGDNIIHSVTNPIPRLTGEREDRGVELPPNLRGGAAQPPA